MRLMVSMCRQHNLTLIIVTHDLEIAEYADRIVHIIDGSIVSIEDNRSKQTTVANENNGANPEKSEIADIAETDEADTDTVSERKE